MWIAIFLCFAAPKPAPSRQLNESACGMVVVRCGHPPPLNELAENYFMVERDDFWINESTKKPASLSQKPVELFKALIELTHWKESEFSMASVALVFYFLFQFNAHAAMLNHKGQVCKCNEIYITIGIENSIPLKLSRVVKFQILF